MINNLFEEENIFNSKKRRNLKKEREKINPIEFFLEIENLFDFKDDSGSDLKYPEIYQEMQSNEFSCSKREDLYYKFQKEKILKINNEHIAILESYKDKWDDRNSKKFDKKIFNNIRNILKNLLNLIYTTQNFKLFKILPIPYLLPNPDGTIDLTWRDDNLYLIINISPNGKVVVVGKSHNEDNIIKIEAKTELEAIIFNWFLSIFELKD